MGEVWPLPAPTLEQWNIEGRTSSKPSGRLYNLRVVFSKAHDGFIDEDIVEANWAAALKRNPKMFNKTKFRLDDTAVDGDTMTLFLGMTDYKNHQGSSLGSSWEELLARGAKWLSANIGNSTAILTSDRKIAFSRRSQHVGEYRGYCALFGGHPEPSELGIDESPVEPSAELNDKIRDKMFSSAIDEVEEETGLTKEHMCAPLEFIGCGWRLEHMRPVAGFVFRTHLAADEVHRIYKAHIGEGKTESSVMETVDIDSVRDGTLLGKYLFVGCSIAVLKYLRELPDSVLFPQQAQN